MGFITDLTPDKRYLGSGNEDNDNDNDSNNGKEYNGLMHIIDWLPTLASFADSQTTSSSSQGMYVYVSVSIYVSV
jgi:hypothetical protein